MAKLIIKILKERPLPSKSITKKGPEVSLEKRVQHAIDCIEADMPSKKSAIEFLTKAKEHLDNPELISLIEKVLSDGT